MPAFALTPQAAGQRFLQPLRNSQQTITICQKSLQKLSKAIRVNISGDKIGAKG
jgi:hypothetical protein